MVKIKRALIMHAHRFPSWSAHVAPRSSRRKEIKISNRSSDADIASSGHFRPACAAPNHTAGGRATRAEIEKKKGRGSPHRRCREQPTTWGEDAHPASAWCSSSAYGRIRDSRRTYRSGRERSGRLVSLGRNGRASMGG